MTAHARRLLAGVLFPALAALAASPASAQTCQPTGTLDGASFPHQLDAFVHVTDSFGPSQEAVEQALEHSMATWNAGCPGVPRRWPRFGFGSSGPENTLVLGVALGTNPQPDGTCANGQPLYAPAAQASFRIGGVVYPYGIEFYTQYGCGDDLQPTFGPDSPYLQPVNLINLVAHEMGHHMGLGHDDCLGVMNGDGNYLYDGTLKPIAEDECVAANQLDVQAECRGNLIGGLATKDHHCPPPNPIGRLRRICDIIPVLCRQPEPWQDPLPWWDVPETTPSRRCTSSWTITCGAGGCEGTVRSSCIFVYSAPLVGPKSVTVVTGPMTGLDRPLPGELLRGVVPVTGWAADAEYGTEAFGLWVDDEPVTLQGAVYGRNRPDVCATLSDPGCPSVGFSGDLDTTALPDGPHLLQVATAEARPSDPGASYYEVPIVVDNTRPTVAVTAPAHGATVDGTVTLSASASDASGIARIRFKIDGVIIDNDYWAPFTAEWNTEQYAEGNHTVTAQAFDAAGNVRSHTATVTVRNDRTAPQVSLTAPVGPLVSGTVQVTAAAVDDEGIVRVELFRGGSLLAVDSTPPYQATWDTTTAADTLHGLQAWAYDAAGNIGVSAIRVVTVDNTPPTRAVGSPNHLQVVSGSSVKIAGWAQDRSSVDGFQVLLDGAPLALNAPLARVYRPDACDAYAEIADPDCPYVGWRAYFDSTRYANGTHTLDLTFTDAAGVASTARRTFVIDNPPVTLAFPPVADTYARQGFPSFNFGREAVLATRTTSDGDGAYSFLKFQVSGVTGPVTAATLRVRTYSPMTDLYLYWLTSSIWGETTLTWYDFPGPGGELGHWLNLAGGAWYTYDLTGYVTGDGTYSVGFANSNPTLAYLFSRESAYPPVLEVRFRP